MVRLKDYEMKAFLDIDIESQSHYGSIKRKQRKTKKREKPSLNPTMVRLKFPTYQGIILNGN